MKWKPQYTLHTVLFSNFLCVFTIWKIKISEQKESLCELWYKYDTNYYVIVARYYLSHLKCWSACNLADLCSVQYKIGNYNLVSIASQIDLHIPVTHHRKPETFYLCSYSAPFLYVKPFTRSLSSLLKTTKLYFQNGIYQLWKISLKYVLQNCGSYLW